MRRAARIDSLSNHQVSAGQELRAYVGHKVGLEVIDGNYASGTGDLHQISVTACARCRRPAQRRGKPACG